MAINKSKFKCRRMITEPNAAALSHTTRYSESNGEEKMMVIFDLGGSSLSVAVVKAEADGIFAIETESSSLEFGGRNFDNLLVEHCL